MISRLSGPVSLLVLDAKRQQSSAGCSAAMVQPLPLSRYRKTIYDNT